MIPSLIGFQKAWTPDRLNWAGWWQTDGGGSLNSVGPDIPATNGQTARRVLDISGNNRHLDQPTGSRQPTFNGTALVYNGGAVMRSEPFNMPIRRTVFLIADILASGSIQFGFEVGGNWNVPGNCWFAPNGNNSNDTEPTLMVVRDDTTANARYKWPEGRAGGIGKCYIICQYGPLAAENRLWLNGTEVVFSNTSGQNFTELTAPVRFSLGGRSGVDGSLATALTRGLYYEAGILAGHLSLSTIAKLNGYLERSAV